MKKSTSLACALLFSGAWNVCLFSQGLGNAPIIFKSDNWSIRQTSDVMTDKKSCVALFKDRFDIQITEKNFTYSLRGKGGVKMITLRFDENQPINRLANDLEKRLSLVYIKDEEFRQLLLAKRLRIQIFTVLDTIVNEDLDLSGFTEIYPKISECKAVVVPSASTSAPTIPPTSVKSDQAPFDLKVELEKLNKLKKEKLITDSEYKEIRKRLVDKAKTN